MKFDEKKFNEAYNHMNIISRQKISQAVCYGDELMLEDEYEKVFYEELKKLDGADQHGMMIRMQEEFNDEILASMPDMMAADEEDPAYDSSVPIVTYTKPTKNIDDYEQFECDDSPTGYEWIHRSRYISSTEISDNGDNMELPAELKQFVEKWRAKALSIDFTREWFVKNASISFVYNNTSYSLVPESLGDIDQQLFEQLETEMVKELKNMGALDVEYSSDLD